MNETIRKRFYTKLFVLPLLFLLLSTLATRAQMPPDTIKIGVKAAPPFVIENNGQYSGLSVSLWQQVALELGMHAQFVQYETPENIISALADSSIDLSINPLSVSRQRLETVAFTQPFFISSLGIAIHESQSQSILAFIGNIFSVDFLKAIGAVFSTIFVFGLLVWLAERNKNDHFHHSIRGIWDGIWWSAVTMTTVGYGDKAPSTVVGKMVSLVWMFAAIILISGFTAGIASALTVNSLDSGIESVNDLKDTRNGAVTGSYAFSFLESNGVAVQEFASVEEGLQALNNRQIETFVYDAPIMRYYINEGGYAEDLEVLPVVLDTDYYAFAAPRFNPLIDLINPVLVELIKKPSWKNKTERYLR